jgi:predicted permease
MQSWLVEAQVALSVVLLVGTVLVARSFTALGAVDPGFDARGVLALQVVLPNARYADREAVAQFHDAVTERAGVVPGVAAVSTVNYLPLNFEWQPTRFSPDGLPDDGTPRPEASKLSVGPDYFDVLRIPVRSGRVIARSDRVGQPNVAVINASMAARHWPDRSPVGATMRIEDSDDPVTIVGVVGDTRHVDLADEGRNQIYVPQAQTPWRYHRVIARVAGDVDAARVPLVAAIHDVDPMLPVVEARPLQEVVDQFLLPQRSLSVSLLVLGGFSLWLALFGIYGIVTCFVADRTRELGVRVALGADSTRIVRYVVFRGLRLAGRGAVVGVLLSVGASLAMQGLLFGVGTSDPLTYLLVVGAVVAVAGAAGLLPARRAARVSPLTAMKAG